jgi:hypothetical protein
VHSKRAYSERVHRVGGPFGTETVLHENDRALTILHQRSEVLVLRFELRLHHNVAGSLRGFEFVFALHTTDVMNDRVVHVLADQVVYVTVERRREQQDLTRSGDVVKQLAHLRGKAHVGHAVGFVNNHHGDLVQASLAAVDEVEEASGSRNGNVDAALQIRDLTSHTGPTEERGDPALRDP